MTYSLRNFEDFMKIYEIYLIKSTTIVIIYSFLSHKTVKINK
ncbi:putative intracellular septation protein A (fragment) [Clostridioides difficile]|uniref:Putative intracellular septation protein A n=1 Tax=Clostridioides difficile TaxID=1496 RepID=A0A069A9B8_CLODI